MGLASKFTPREWWTLFGIGSTNLCTGILISLQAPFYPEEAESKGATATEYGFVFGVYELVGFLISPVFGKYLNIVGTMFMLRSGIFVAGCASIFFGFLEHVNGQVQFITLSFAVRIVESLGANACLTSSFSIVATIFPDSVATVFATLETLYGLGYIVGPAIGGLLYTIGGFKLPFFIVGFLLLVDGVFVYLVMPNIDDDSITRPQAKLLAYLKLTPVLLDMLSVATASVGFGFLSAVLEPHLRQFDLTALSTGLVFVVLGGMYAILAPLVGRLCDKYINPKTLILTGFVVSVAGFMMIGPVPYTPIEPSLLLVCLGMAVQGTAQALLIVPAFVDAIRSSVACGLPDDISTYGVVSGLWGASFAFGAFVGPSVSGALYDSVGFRDGTLFVIACNSIMFIAMLTHVIWEWRKVSRPLCRDVTPLTLGSSNGVNHHDKYGSIALCLVEK